MKRSLALAGALTLAAVLAGCAEPLTPASTGDAPVLPGLEIRVFPETGDAHTTFHFEVPPLHRAGLAYAWDFGDGNTVTGKRASHKFGFTNGLMPVVLTAEDTLTGEVFQVTRLIRLGTGENRLPTADLGLASDWVEIHEPVQATARNSTDPDGDPLLFLWTYAEWAGGHDGEGEAASDEFVIGDRGPELNHTFERPGFYRLSVRAMDPKGAESTDAWIVAVTPAVPPRVFERVFTGELAAGTAGQGASHEAWKQTGVEAGADSALHAYELRFPGTTTLTLTWGDAGAGLNDLDLYVVDPGTGDVIAAAETRGPDNLDETLVIEEAEGAHALLVKSYSGAGIAYELTVRTDLAITPADLLPAHGDDGHGHEH